MAKKAANTPVKIDASMRIMVLHGPERFLIEEYTRQFIAMLDEKFGGVEQFNFDGETVPPAAVLDELRSYGLMQKHKLVILDNADAFLAGGGKGATEDDDDDDDVDNDAGERSTRRPVMERYAENPVAEATLLMRARSWRSGKLDKLIAKVGAVNFCDTPSPAKAASWCIGRVERRYNTTLEPAAATLLVDRVGPELLHLDTELQKLAAMAGESKPITAAHVAEAVGLSREEKAWEIQTAIVTGDAAAMIRRLRELLEISQQDPVPLTWAICDILRKMHAASQLMHRGVSHQSAFAQARLFGPAANGAIQLASEHEPEIFAQLLQSAIRTDVHNKTGVGDPKRSLEGLLVKIADTLAPVAA